MFVYFFFFSEGLTTYVLQSSYLNLKLSDDHALPASSLVCFYIVSMIIVVPVLDRIFYPALRRLGFKLTTLRRIGIGFLFASASMILAGIIEIERKRVIKTDGTIMQNVFNKPVNASTISVFYQVPQYILHGTSEGFAVITG